MSVLILEDIQSKSGNGPTLTKETVQLNIEWQWKKPHKRQQIPSLNSRSNSAAEQKAAEDKLIW